MKTRKEGGACFLRRVSGVLYLYSEDKTVGCSGMLPKQLPLPLTPKPDLTQRSEGNSVHVHRVSVCLTSSSIGLTPGKEDEKTVARVCSCN